MAVAAIEQMIVGDPFAEATTHGPLANRAQFGRVQQMIEAGIDEGTKLIAGGAGRPVGFSKGFYARPTIFSDVRTDMTIAQQEIFGPVLAILPYDTVEEAIDIANDTVYGLGAHVQGSGQGTASRGRREHPVGQGASELPGMGPAGSFSAGTSSLETDASMGSKAWKSTWRSSRSSGTTRESLLCL